MRKASLGNGEISRIGRSLGIAQFSTIKEITSGSINPVYLIDDKYILRIDPLDVGNDGKFLKEVFLFEKLKQLSIPVPTVIAHDESRTLIKYPFILMEVMHGDNLIDSYPKQSPETKQKLCLEMGSLVKQINQIKSGDLDNNQILGNIDLWVAKIKENFEIYFSHVRDKHFFIDSVNDDIAAIYAEFCMILDWREVGSLVHGDINPTNIKVLDGKIAGIFDFEYAMIGDPLADLERLPINFQMPKDFYLDMFLRGYGVTKFTSQELVRLKMYALNQGLWEIWATDTQQFPYGQKEMDEGKALVLNTLSIQNDAIISNKLNDN